MGTRKQKSKFPLEINKSLEMYSNLIKKPNYSKNSFMKKFSLIGGKTRKKRSSKKKSRRQ